MTYLLTSELHSVGAGLCAAGMIAIVPGYISRYNYIYNFLESFSNIYVLSCIEINIDKIAINK